MKKTTKMNAKNIRKAYLILIAILSSTSLMMTTASATGGAPVTNDFMNTTISIVFWAVRILIGFFGVQGGVKVAQAQAEEDARGRNAGLATIGICGVMIAVSFAIEAVTK